MKAIDRARGHYSRLVAAPKKIPVPEWAEEGEEFFVYATPLTLNERAKIGRFAKNPQEMAAELLILKAKDAAGAPLFAKEEKFDIMREVASDVIARITTEIVGIPDAEIVADAEGN
jgi:3-deoxy-D-arabino-heptulosonate 7-phosphate (DAHP) synthase